MKPLLLSLSAGMLALGAACTPTDRGTATGALTGAALGAAISDDGDRAQGAIGGAAIGAIAGTLIGRANEPGQCIYRDQYGNRYTARC